MTDVARQLGRGWKQISVMEVATTGIDRVVVWSPYDWHQGALEVGSKIHVGGRPWAITAVNKVPDPDYGVELELESPRFEYRGE